MGLSLSTSLSDCKKVFCKLIALLIIERGYGIVKLMGLYVCTLYVIGIELWVWLILYRKIIIYEAVKVEN